MRDEEYEEMVERNLATIEHVKCRRGTHKACYDGRPLLQSIYNEDGTMERARANYLNDGTLADDGTIVCDACYTGF